MLFRNIFTNLNTAMRSSHSNSGSFRTDIAGLRGIAVLMVTLCHFEIPGFGGGLHRSRHFLRTVGLFDHWAACQGI